MDIYLPIAEVSVNWPVLVLLGGMVGFVSGLFGIGGGFLMAPILVVLGIPPTVAVASQASHVVASSTSGVISYSSRGAVDFRMGGIMAGGGIMDYLWYIVGAVVLAPGLGRVLVAGLRAQTHRLGAPAAGSAVDHGGPDLLGGRRWLLRPVGVLHVSSSPPRPRHRFRSRMKDMFPGSRWHFL